MSASTSTPANVKDVAALANVSVGTVSNVLNHPEKVALSTRKRVTAAMNELDFVPNETARALRRGVALNWETK